VTHVDVVLIAVVTDKSSSSSPPVTTTTEIKAVAGPPAVVEPNISFMLVVTFVLLSVCVAIVMTCAVVLGIRKICFTGNIVMSIGSLL